MKKPIEEYQSLISRLFPDDERRIRSVTLQVTDACNLCCSYCYQHNKGHHMMDFDTAKQFIDMLLAGENPYINFENTRGITIDFIGGEPFLAIDLIDKITEYILNKMIQENHPWLFRTRFSICSNGVLYFEPKVQTYLQKYHDWVSFTVSIDGDKMLHDSCRIFADGSGSYDLAVAAAKHYMKTYGKIGTKMTLAPSNVMYTARALENLINIGYNQIFCNCIFEEGWESSHATVLYWQLKKMADYLFENNLYDEIYISIFEEDNFVPIPLEDDKNWCGGDGSMIAVDYKGDIFPCLRYMESSLGSDAEPIIIGTVSEGIEVTPKQQQWVKCLQCMTRCSQSTKECIECPIARGCAYCSAYNYQYFGELNKRTTFTCEMHKARALANVYFWNRYYHETGSDKRMHCNVPRDWALKIIPEDEYNFLLSTEN